MVAESRCYSSHRSDLPYTTRRRGDHSTFDESISVQLSAACPRIALYHARFWRDGSPLWFIYPLSMLAMEGQLMDAPTYDVALLRLPTSTVQRVQHALPCEICSLLSHKRYSVDRHLTRQCYYTASQHVLRRPRRFHQRHAVDPSTGIYAYTLSRASSIDGFSGSDYGPRILACLRL